jgi:hypothetical protein
MTRRDRRTHRRIHDAARRSLALLFLVAAAAVLSRCGKEAPKPPEPGPAAPAAKPPRPEKLPNGEPAAVSVKHVLIAFQGATRSQATRSREEAERLAYEVLSRAKAGEEFEKLMRELSDDRGARDGRAYDMANDGVPTHGEEFERGGMAKDFGDVSFRIGVGEIGFAPYDPQTCGFGYHIIKRVK